MEFNNSYSFNSRENIAEDFLIKALRSSVSYKRVAGYFSVNSMIHLSEGIKELVRNNGNIKVITSPNLSDEDIKVLKKGYQEKEKLISEMLDIQISQEKLFVKVENVEDIIELIKSGNLEIKIAVNKNAGLFHDKFGILEDSFGNKLCFLGSANETYSAYNSNYEKIRVFKNWEISASGIVHDEESDFNKIWDNKHEALETYEFPDALKKKLIERIEHEKNHLINDPNRDYDFMGEDKDDPNKALDDNTDEIKLRDYQREAISAWSSNSYNGFFEMATGTGKTWTALYGIKQLYEQKHAVTTIIIAPYIHLIEQWREDIKKIFPYIQTVMVSSKNKDWENILRNKMILKKRKKPEHLIIIATQQSFALERFQKVIQKCIDDKLLVVDEAHRFVNLVDKIDESFNYTLGLSATPHFSDQEKTKKLITFFQKIVYKYTIEEALGKHLVNYEYHPFYVCLSAEEEKKYKKAQSQIAACFDSNGKLIKSEELLHKYFRNKNLILARAQEKQNRLHEFLLQIPEKSNLIVYSGDGFLNPDQRYIDKLTTDLNELNFNVHKFTSTENLQERMAMIKDFSHQRIDILAAIKCLDEGVNIPSIRAALLLASNDNKREFIQRRGRILRKFKNKSLAKIYDVIVLPANDQLVSIPKKEFKRFYEYARLAINSEELLRELNKYLIRYDLEYQDLQFEDYDHDYKEEIIDA